eukprot:Nitzschia sp. Nitz4//scaffold182_size44100//24352//26928//NITZ4_007256-RA/size44100-processed-gene-0.86-mRNA-1//-1//CDS//3329539571//3121//frame0
MRLGIHLPKGSLPMCLAVVLCVLQQSAAFLPLLSRASISSRCSSDLPSIFTSLKPSTSASCGQKSPGLPLYSTSKYDLDLLLVDHYDSFTYNLYDYFSQFLARPPQVISKDAYNEWESKQWTHLDGIILSPGPGSPQEQPPFSHQAISKNPNLPVLGVCLGHQLMALAYGAEVGKAPVPIHGQEHMIEQEYLPRDSPSPMFRNLPLEFPVVRYHSLAASHLPDCLQITARSKQDKVIQAFQHKHNPHYGLQFHPESIGTHHGKKLVENFCEIAQRHQRQRLAKSSRNQSFGVGKLSVTKSEAKTDAVSPAKFRVVMQPFHAPAKPLQVFHALYSNRSHSMWLDSSSFPSRGKMDIMASPTRPEDIVEYRLEAGESKADILTQLERNLFGQGRQPSVTELALISSDVSVPSALKFDPDVNISASIPFDYRGGYLGYLSYEVRHDTERFLRNSTQIHNQEEDMAHDWEAPPTAAFFLARQSLVYHHPTKCWYAIALVANDESNKNAIDWIQAVSSQVQALEPDSETSSTPSVGSKAKSAKQLDWILRRNDTVYKSDIDKCHEFIRQGESYELCLTNQLEATVPQKTRDTWDLYTILRRRNPAPYSAFMRWGAKPTISGRAQTAWSICSSSPERFMSVKRHLSVDGSMSLEAEAKPIKGTEPRVQPSNGYILSTAEQLEDQRRAECLETSTKNRAENLMIVDLLRNDMSRVCKVGSVHVAKLMGIESFATVHQMVSTIRGTLQEQSTCVDLLRASFPGGSMTGAPKLRTMELLSVLEENQSRGPYSGCLGYLSINGCMDFNIIIRSAIVSSTADGGHLIQVGAGGAITALSDSQDEFDEMILKTRAVVEAANEWNAPVCTE